MAAPVWTPERIDFLTREYPLGTPISKILATINTLPGHPTTKDAIHTRVRILGVRRPEHQRLGAVKWSAERLDVLRREYAEGVHVEVIHQHINALSGPEISAYGVIKRAMELHLRRPAWFIVAVTRDKTPRTWTAERSALLKAMYLDGAPSEEIAVAINQLPGCPVTDRSVMRQAFTLGIRRPDWFRLDAARKGARVRGDNIRRAHMPPPPPPPAPPVLWASLQRPKRAFSMLGGAIR